MYAYAIDAYLQKGMDDKAFVAAERGRARLFLDLLSTRNVHLDATEEEMLDGLYTAYAVRDTAEVSLVQARAYAPRLVARLEQERDRADQQVEILLDRIQAEYPKLTALVPGATEFLSIEELQHRVLDEDTTLIVYHTRAGALNASTLAWVIDQEEYAVVELSVDGRDLATRVEFFRDNHSRQRR